MRERHDQNRWRWRYEIHVGEPKTIRNELFGDIEVIPVLEKRHVGRGRYYSEQTFFLTENGRVVRWTYKDPEGTQVCNRVE